MNKPTILALVEAIQLFQFSVLNRQCLVFSLQLGDSLLGQIGFLLVRRRHLEHFASQLGNRLGQGLDLALAVKFSINAKTILLAFDGR